MYHRDQMPTDKLRPLSKGFEDTYIQIPANGTLTSLLFHLERKSSYINHRLLVQIMLASHSQC